jgi:hypothetical protein
MTDSKVKYYDEKDGDKIAELLVGRRIVRAEMGGDYSDFPAQTSWDRNPEGLLELDDGTKLYLTGHEGGCACSAGDYPLKRVAATENIITSARVHCDPEEDYGDTGEGVYRIFVFAGADEINVASFEGSDGNGWYGTGFSLTVVRPDE